VIPNTVAVVAAPASQIFEIYPSVSPSVYWLEPPPTPEELSLELGIVLWKGASMKISRDVNIEGQSNPPPELLPQFSGYR